MVVQENTVVQANALIEKKPKMTRDEQRLFLSIVSMIDSKNQDFDQYEISVRDFAQVWGVGIDSAYSQFIAAVDGLLSKKFFDETVNERGKRNFYGTTFISSGKYTEGEAYAKIRLDPDFKPYLLGLKETYTQYMLKYVVNLNSKHSIRIYELLKQYEKIGSRTFDISDLKEMLAIPGKYPNNSNFVRVVLNPAVDEINDGTDLKVKFEMIGRGKDARVRFDIKPNEKMFKHDKPEKKKKSKISKDILDLARSVLDANEVKSVPEPYIEYLLKQSQAVKSPNAFLKKCLLNTENVIKYKEYIQTEEEHEAKRLQNEEITGQIELEIQEERSRQIEEFNANLPQEIRDMPEGLDKVRRIAAYKQAFKEV